MTMTTYVAVDSTTEAPARDGIVYPLAMTGIAQIAFLKQANGSFVTVGGNNRGIQTGRPTMDEAAISNGRPYCRRQPSQRYKRPIPDATVPIPMDLVTSSHCEGLTYARGFHRSDIVAKLIHGWVHVNVLELDLALDGKLGPRRIGYI